MEAKRREFLKISGLVIAAASVPGIAEAASVIPMPEKKGKFLFSLGVASYSLRKFPVDKALEMTVRLGINKISFKDFHLKLNADKDTITKTVALCNEKGVELYSGGVIYMRSKADVDQAFEYAKAAGMKLIIGVPNHELLDYVEEKIKGYNLPVAIHNHGPGDKLYPSAESAYNLIKNRDKRFGLCIDIGHTKRIGRDPEQDLVDFFDRVMDIHIKDVTAATSEGGTCAIGRGVINFPSFLKTVIRKKYSGVLSLEYEADENDPLPGMAESFGYVRGILAMMK